MTLKTIWRSAVGRAPGDSAPPRVLPPDILPGEKVGREKLAWEETITILLGDIGGVRRVVRVILSLSQYLTFRRLSSRASWSKSPPNNFLKLLILTTILFIKFYWSVEYFTRNFWVSLITVRLRDPRRLTPDLMCLCICIEVPALCLSSLHTGLVFIQDAPKENGPSLLLAGHNVSISFFWRIPTFSPSEAFYCLSQVQRFFPFIIVRLGRNSCKKLSSSVSQLLLSLFWKKHKGLSGERVLSCYATRRKNWLDWRC